MIILYKREFNLYVMVSIRYTYIFTSSKNMSGRFADVTNTHNFFTYLWPPSRKKIKDRQPSRLLHEPIVNFPLFFFKRNLRFMLVIKLVIAKVMWSVMMFYNIFRWITNQNGLASSSESEPTLCSFCVIHTKWSGDWVV